MELDRLAHKTLVAAAAGVCAALFGIGAAAAVDETTGPLVSPAGSDGGSGGFCEETGADNDDGDDDGLLGILDILGGDDDDGSDGDNGDGDDDGLLGILSSGDDSNGSDGRSGDCDESPGDSVDDDGTGTSDS